MLKVVSLASVIVVDSEEVFSLNGLGRCVTRKSVDEADFA
jgi:hypothetical protein